MARTRVPIPSSWKQETRQEDVLRLAIGELGLPVRTANLLETIDVLSVRDLLAKRPSELMAIRNFGATTLDATVDALVKVGFLRPDRVSLPPHQPLREILLFGNEC